MTPNFFPPRAPERVLVPTTPPLGDSACREEGGEKRQMKRRKITSLFSNFGISPALSRIWGLSGFK
jgi:hypothetical protein